MCSNRISPIESGAMLQISVYRRSKHASSEGAKLIFLYQGQRLQSRVEEIANSLGVDGIYMCDASCVESVSGVFDKIGKSITQ